MPSLLLGDGCDKDEPRMEAGGLEGGDWCQRRRRPKCRPTGRLVWCWIDRSRGLGQIAASSPGPEEAQVSLPKAEGGSQERMSRLVPDDGAVHLL